MSANFHTGKILPAASLPEAKAYDSVATGIETFDRACGGVPRGALTEVSGPQSSGKTTVLYAALARIAACGESCSVIDAGDHLDPQTARAAGLDLASLLWIRCGGSLEKTLKITDMLLQGGGFGMIALDLGDLPPELVRKIPAMYWFRYRRAVENTRAVFLVVSPLHITGSSASLALQAESGIPRWAGTRHSPFLAGIEFRMSFGRLRTARPGSCTAEKVCLHASMDPLLRKIS